MKERARKYLEAGGPMEVWHGEYVGRLVDVEQLNDGLVIGVYHFEGGEFIGDTAPVLRI